MKNVLKKFEAARPFAVIYRNRLLLHRRTPKYWIPEEGGGETTEKGKLKGGRFLLDPPVW